ncbi:hypothetical protein ACP4OV_021999 [Aristida adscensionis]
MALKLLLVILAPLLQLALAIPTNGSSGGNITSCAPATCGNLSITYPFLLGGKQRPDCGFPAFELTCDGAGRAYLTRAFRERLYRVDAIFYENQSLVVAVEAAFAGDETCRVPDFNVSSSLALFPLSISKTNKNLVFVNNCDVPRSMRLQQPCANHTMGAYISERRDADGNLTQGLPTNCSSLTVPVRAFQEEEEEPARRHYQRLISDGFLVEWPAEGDCDACRLRGGECRYVAFSFQCTCPDGLLCSTSPSPPAPGSAIHVLGVDYANSSFVASHARVAADNGVCRADFNMSSAVAMTPFTISARNRALCFLQGCNGTEPQGPGYVNATSGCTGGGGAILAFLAGSYHGDSPPAIETGRCTYTYFPVLGPEAAAMTAANYSRLLRDGFVMEWVAAGVGDCAACKASGGQCRYDNDAAALACICPGGDQRGSTCAGAGDGTIILIVLMAAAASLLFPCICVMIRKRKVKKLWFVLRERTRRTNDRNIEALIVSYGSLAPKRYKYSEVVNITSSLNNKLGQGGYGMVFKGRLYDGRLVAVKFLHECKGNGEEFVNEVMSIGRTSHINIVSLFGFCLERSKRALIYEYMPNGSLDQYIYSENPKEILGWQKLYTIAIGIARGLEYLHHSCNTRIVHFDIKPQNILLDQDFCPKIADFGLAKLCHSKESKLSMTGTRGTIGFIAPEVHSRTFGVVSTKSDVYSYGMMLLEMVGGRKNVKSAVQKSSEKYFPDWIYNHFPEDDGLQACEVTDEDEEIARKMILIGLWCIQVMPMHRPSITKVLEMFERELDKLDMPPKQNFSQILEDSIYNLNTGSTNPSSSANTQGSSEMLKIDEINLVNSKNHLTVTNSAS